MTEPTKTSKKKPTWSDLKRNLAEVDRAGLLSLVKDIYASSKENKAFLHSRFDLGDEFLDPYKKNIERWIWPDVIYKNQNYSVAKAKKAISDYKKAAGQAVYIAELQVFFCEQAAGFCSQVGLDDEAYFTALVRMFEQAMKTIDSLAPDFQEDFVDRLQQVSYTCRAVGWGVDDDMESLLDNWYLEGEEDQ